MLLSYLNQLKLNTTYSIILIQTNQMRPVRPGMKKPAPSQNAINLVPPHPLRKKAEDVKKPPRPTKTTWSSMKNNKTKPTYNIYHIETPRICQVDPCLARHDIHPNPRGVQSSSLTQQDNVRLLRTKRQTQRYS